MESDRFANLIRDVLEGEKDLLDYATELGKVKTQLHSMKKYRESDDEEVIELEKLAETLEAVIENKLYVDKENPAKGSPQLKLVE